MSEYNAQRKVGTPPEERIGNVTSITDRKRSKVRPAASNARLAQSNPHLDDIEPGPNEKSIHTQFGRVRDEHPARFEMLLSGARILDDPERVNIHPTTIRQMEMIIEKITAKKKTKSGGRLATVSAMAGRRSG
jgi:hypothetical protein